MSDVVEHPRLSAEHLADLAETLQRAGYKIATQQCVWAQQLLVRLALEGRLPEDLRQLGPHFAPIFCCTPDQQRRFAAVFEEWLQRRHLVDAVGPAEAPRDRKPDRRPIRPVAFRWALAVGAALVLAVGAWAWDHWRWREFVGTVTAAGQPLAGATVAFLEEEDESDARGRFTLRYRKSQLGESVEASKEGFTTTRQRLTAPVPARLDLALEPSTPEPLPPTAGNRTDLPAPDGASNFSVTLAAVLQAPQPVDWRRLGLSALPLVMFGAWLAWTHWRRRPMLQRDLSTTPPNLKEVHLSGGVRQLLPGLAVRQLARELRRRRTVNSRELDTAATIQASLRNAGFFIPVYGSRVEPDYLVLIDRASFVDHQARLADEIVTTLERSDVSLERFYYDGDPRLCRWRPEAGRAGGSEAVGLDELALRFPDHRVLLFSDGGGFFDGFTGEPARWLGAFERWREKVVLTPETPARWGRREWAIERLGFALLPLSRGGFEALGELFRDRPQTPLAPAGAATVSTPRFARTPARWLEREAPGAETTEQLCADLEAHLGKAGFQWLAACAVYPEVHWGLTLRLGSQLVAQGREFEALLPRLARLVWLREGYLPDWFREALIGRLSPETQRQVREVLQGLLAQAVTGPDEASPLRIAVEDPGGVRRWRRRLGQWWARRKSRSRLADAARAADPDSPLRDYVFLRFVSGQTASPLGLRAPGVLVRMLFPQGVRLFGLRRVVAGALCCLGAAGLFVKVPKPAPACIYSASFSPDGTKIATAGTDATARLWDAASGRLLGGPFRHPAAVWSASFSPDGSKLVTASWDKTAQLWDVASGRPLGGPLHHEANVASASFSPDGSKVVTASWDKTARLWDVASGRALGGPMVHDDLVRSGRFSPDGSKVVTACADHTARLWDVASGKALGSPLRHPAGVTSASFSPDGSEVVTACDDDTARLWNVAFGREVGSTLVHAGGVASASFSPDGSQVVTASFDKTARLWEAANGKPLGEPLRHESRVYSAAFSPDGNRVVTGSADGTVRLWSLNRGGQARALLIGCDYRNDKTGMSLANPVRDVKALGQALNQQYGFGVTILENPTYTQATQTLSQITRTLGTNDSFLLALSGMGFLPDKVQFAFPFAVQSQGPSLTQRELANSLVRLPARQALVIADCSEAHRMISRNTPAKPDPGPVRARMVLSASSPAAPNPSDGTPGKGSPFTLAVLDALGASPGPSTGQQLYDRVARSMSGGDQRQQTKAQAAQRPSYGPFGEAGHTGGDFQFPPRRTPQPSGSSELPKPGARSHVVAKGDSLALIAKQYGVSQRELVNANPGLDLRRLRINQRIVVPPARAYPTASDLPPQTAVTNNPPAAPRNLKMAE